MVAIPEGFRRPWESDREQRETEELEQLAALLTALLGVTGWGFTLRRLLRTLRRRGQHSSKHVEAKAGHMVALDYVPPKLCATGVHCSPAWPSATLAEMRVAIGGQWITIATLTGVITAVRYQP